MLEKSLHRAVWIDLHLQEQPDALENPWRFQVQDLGRPSHPLPIGTSIVQVHDEADGELLILGEPGAGKTTLLLELARTLLERAEKDEQHPMPLVFNLSSWAEKRQPLRGWLAEELQTKYQVPRQIGEAWLDADQVLPLLDGLDEVATEVRSSCVEQINAYHQSRQICGRSPLVVCCRSEEYAMLSTRVRLQCAVCILPLTDEQITLYLEQIGEQVKTLRQALKEDLGLHSLARQPLMLNIFTLAYQGSMLWEVPTGETREGAQHLIFARYVERMLKRRRQLRHWKPEQVIRWLMFLARQMQHHDQTVFSLENLQPTWLSKKWRLLYLWGVWLIIGLVVGLVGGLLASLLAGPVVGSTVGTLSGLVSGLIGRQMSDLTRRLTGRFIVVLLFGLAGGLVSGLVAMLVSGPTDGLYVGMVIGLLFWLIVGLDTRIKPAETLSWSWKKVRSGSVLGAAAELGCGLLFGLVLGLLFGLHIGSLQLHM